jgi:hypothetical protein
LNARFFLQRWPQQEAFMRYFAIKYKNGVEDIVPAPLLDQLIVSGSVKQFFRPSEQRWITVGMDYTRGLGGSYEGVDRRWHIPQAPMIRVERQSSPNTNHALKP